MHEPEESQRNILRRLIAANANCEFGRAHGFDRIRSYEEFRQRVPIMEGEDLEPWVERIQHGRPAVLTREPVTRLLPTSGSTGGRKLIPFTATFQRELNAAIGPWIVDLCRQHPSVALGPAYWSVSPAIDLPAEMSAVPVGFDDDSAYVGGLRRQLVEAVLAVPPALRLVRDVECLRYLTLLCLLRQRGLRLISVWHPSFLTLLLDALPAYWDELLRDIKDGGCRRGSDLPLEVRQAVSRGPLATRAKELLRIGPDNPRAWWPHLQVVSCWADAQAALPARDLQRRLPHAFVQAKGLLATEAFVSIPFRGLHPVAVGSHFFEFVDARNEMRLAHELQRGETYSVIVTTGGGLWRYRLGDLVEVDGSVGRTPSLRFLGRVGNVSDLCGEKLAEPFVTRATQAACAKRGLSPRFALLAPETEGRRWHYTLFIEGHVTAALAASLETELRANPHYALCRDLGQLGPIRVCPVDSGAYETFCAEAADDGRRWGDVKPQSLSSRTNWRRRFQQAALHL
jgi:hypothetical protein